MDFGADGADILLNREKIAIGETVEIVAAGAEIREWAAGRGRKYLAAGPIGPGPVIRHAEIRQSVDVGVYIIGRDLHRIDRRPLQCDEAAAAVVGGVVPAGNIGVLE